MWKKLLPILLPLLLASCLGTRMTLGTGHAFNDGGGSFRSPGNFDDHGGGGSSFDFDQGDSTGIWTSIDFPISWEEEKVHIPSLPPLPPIIRTPVTEDYGPAIEALVLRLVAVEEEEGDHIGWKDMGLGGISGAGLLYLITAILNRRNKGGEE